MKYKSKKVVKTYTNNKTDIREVYIHKKMKFYASVKSYI